MPTAERWKEKRNPNEWRRKLPVEAASGLNDGLGSDEAITIGRSLYWIEMVWIGFRCWSGWKFR